MPLWLEILLNLLLFALLFAPVWAGELWEYLYRVWVKKS
jgi:hypothetical protein